MPNHLAPWTLLPGVPEGTCPECAVAHDPSEPHNAQSLTYQYKFFDAHGRWPDWRDAMSHCTEKIKTLWRTELARAGVDVDAGKVNPARKQKVNTP